MASRKPSSSRGELAIGGRPLKPGDRLGAYVFQREIGSGGMAHVLLARDPSGDPIALKVLKESRLQTGLARFRREFHALSRIKHPNVIRVDAYGDLHGHPFIAMEFVDGPDLHTTIRSLRNTPDEARFERAESILVDLCRALAAIHRRGLVHRDLKPSNVLIGADGACKLTDFGIVKQLDPRRDPHLSTTLVGTWAYTSPEHISGRAVDHRSDLYSLGVILFALLTGKRPFVADNMAGYLEQHRDYRPPRPSQIKANVPAHLDNICVRLLAKLPRDRFQSAQEVLYRLKADTSYEELEAQSGWEPPLVGNRHAVERLEEAVAALTARRGGVIRLFGEDGSGKSRLTHVVMERAKMLGMTPKLYAFQPEAPVFSVAVKMARDLMRELPDDHSKDLERIVRAFAEGSALRGDTRYALYDALKGALEVALAEQPQVYVLDDTHEATGPELHLFHYLSRSLLGNDEPHPLLLVLASRPISAHTSQGVEERSFGVLPTDLSLQPLSEADVLVMVESLVGRGKQAQRIADRLHSDADGNPYFVSEFLRSLIASNLITQSEAGAWHLTIDAEELAGSHLEIPASIRQVLGQRLEGVSPADRKVLEVLAISGQTLELDILLEVLDLDEEELLQRLDRLLVAGLVREFRDGEELSHCIVHKKLADMIRQDLNEPTERKLHRRLAEALEMFSAHAPEVLEVIGEHYRKAGLAGRAYTHLVTAARRLAERNMEQEAWELSERAGAVEHAAQADLSPEVFLSHRKDQLRVRGAALQTHAAWEQAMVAWGELLRLCESTDDAHGVCEARLSLARTLRRRGEHARSLHETELALEGARKLHDRKLVASGLHQLSAIAWKRGYLAQCESLAHEGLLVAHGEAVAEERAQLLQVLALAQAIQGQLGAALRGLEEAARIFEDLRMLGPRVLALSNIAELQAWQGRPIRSFQSAQAARAISTDLRYPLGHMVSMRAQGMAHFLTGRYALAQQELQQALGAAREIQLPGQVLANAVLLAELCLERSDTMGAIHHAMEGLAISPEADVERYIPQLQAILAGALARSQPSTAWKLLHAVEAALPTLHVPRQVQVRNAVANAWVALGDRTRAEEHAQQVLRDRSARSFKLDNLKARSMLAQVTHGETSRRHLRIALESAEEFVAALPKEEQASVRRRPFLRNLLGSDHPFDGGWRTDERSVPRSGGSSSVPR